MEAIRQIKKTTGRKLTINLPERFSGLEVEIIILPVAEKQELSLDKLECLLLSERSLEGDWNKDTEDRTWKNL